VSDDGWFARVHFVVLLREERAMSVMKILIDGLEFSAKIYGPGATREQLEEWASKFRSSLGDVASLSIELVDGSFLVLGEKQLERSVFLFCPKA
jgi:hypothetical protein